MINYTPRLNRAIITAAQAHDGHYRKGDGKPIPYIIHPFGVMIIASNVTDDEDTLIACLFHDILEDIDSEKYNEHTMRQEYGDRVVSIVKDVTKDESADDWHERSKAYLSHLENKANNEAVIVSGADKVHNLHSIVEDYKKDGDELWTRFTTASKEDQIWWYTSIKEILVKRQAPQALIDKLEDLLSEIATTDGLSQDVKNGLHGKAN